MFSLELLNQAEGNVVSSDEFAAWAKQDILIKTLADFKVKASADTISVGPTVTRIEFQLAPGILVGKVERLMDNIAMALSVPSVHFVKHIQGKTTMGIEIPNDTAQVVTLKECLESARFKNSESLLTFALGKDISGEIRCADLQKMPHLLVGGSTNSGKSSFLNSTILSILSRATPEEVKFIMIDPKRVELSFYKNIPHLMMPVITDIEEASKALKGLIVEMERRLDLFESVSTRNLEGYNDMQENCNKLPFIVLVIDELAELMMTAGKEVEPAICRLAQLARATGIHLIVATQRPSVDVITGLIKSNIGSRISFSVQSAGDSRTILGHNGAETLIGKGDMLYMPIGTQPNRIQGCYVSEEETHAVVESIKANTEKSQEFIENGFINPFDARSDNEVAEEILPDVILWSALQNGFTIENIQLEFRCSPTVAQKVIESLKVYCIITLANGCYHSKHNASTAHRFVMTHFN